MMSDITTTSLNDLPSDPSVGGNVKINIQEQPNSGAIALDQTTISQIVNDLQQATLSGATRLPSSHIPMNQTHITTDNTVRPNYVPEYQHNKYINDVENYDYNIPESKTLFDKFYDNFHFSLLLAILFFIFQMPSFKNFAFQNAQFLFSADGNYNFNGLVAMSLMFASIYHVFTIYF